MSNIYWKLDPGHSEFIFSVKHLMISKVSGMFHGFEGIIKGSDYLNSPIEVIIDATSVSTNSPDRDNHIRSSAFLDVENFTQLSFTSPSLQLLTEETFEVPGILTIKGISNPVTFKAEFGGRIKDPKGNEKIGFSVEGVINRKKWGINWNVLLESGGLLVSEEVKLSAQVQFVKVDQ